MLSIDMCLNGNLFVGFDCIPLALGAEIKLSPCTSFNPTQGPWTLFFTH